MYTSLEKLLTEMRFVTRQRTHIESFIYNRLFAKQFIVETMVK